MVKRTRLNVTSFIMETQAFTLHKKLDFMCFLREVRDSKALPVLRPLVPNTSSRRQGLEPDPVHLQFVGGQHNVTYHVKQIKKLCKII